MAPTPGLELFLTVIHNPRAQPQTLAASTPAAGTFLRSSHGLLVVSGVRRLRGAWRPLTPSIECVTAFPSATPWFDVTCAPRAFPSLSLPALRACLLCVRLLCHVTVWLRTPMRLGREGFCEGACASWQGEAPFPGAASLLTRTELQ